MIPKEGAMSEASINHTTEIPARTTPGGPMLLLLLALAAAAVLLFLRAASGGDEAFSGWEVMAAGFCSAGATFVLLGFYTLQPNEAAAILLFGQYKGTDRTNGLRWVLFWYLRRKISLRVRNVTSETLKVNDKRGNPVEIAANIVWRVSDSAQALFNVDDYLTFVNIQIETALRETASHYAYDYAEAEEPTLRADAELVGARLKEDLQRRVAVAGLSVDEAHLMHLAYAPEIAGAMLRRQQADAVLSARRKIVAGAVGMVEHALEQLSTRGVVQLDEERKAAMVSNLLVVLCGERDTQPVVNAGTLYTG
jgi:regulator of protease activity HflC (stomatin/prohibitin superfamily)